MGGGRVGGARVGGVESGRGREWEGGARVEGRGRVGGVRGGALLRSPGNPIVVC